MKQSSICAIFVCLFLAMPSLVDASVVLRGGEKVNLDKEQVVSGDFYAAGSAVTVSGTVEGDLYAAGGSITVNGDVGDDIVALGGAVQIHGPVGDGVRVVGGEVVVADAVAGDVVVVGGTLNILSTATVEGDVLLFSGEAVISGDVRGDIIGEVESLRVDGATDGDVDVTTRSLVLGEKAYLGANVTYRSEQDLKRAPGSVVVGDIKKESTPRTSFGSPSSVSVLPFLTFLFTTLVYLLLFRERMNEFIAHLSHSFGTHGLVGLAAFFVTPIVALLLFVSVLGIPIGLVLLFGYILAIIIAWSLSGIFLGALLSKVIRKESSTRIIWAILGVLLAQILLFIPFVGPLIVFVVVLIILGGLLTLFYNKIR